MTHISFVSANFVAKQLGYHMTGGWAEGESATNAYFAPLDTFAERFDEMLTAVQSMGFEAIDIWTAHLNWRWATDAHIVQARALLDRHGLTVTSIGGSFGAMEEEFATACRLAVALDTTILAGGTALLDTNRDAVIATLQRYGVNLGLENHPGMLTPTEVLTRIGDGGQGTIGTTVDTGWFGTAGSDAVAAIERLGPFVMAVHLKDVRAPGGHVTCRYGQGCVPIEACVYALERIGYHGYIAIEHEPDDFDPTEDCLANLAMLRAWITESTEKTGASH